GAFAQLIEQHGDLRDPRVATAYLLLGDLYERVGRGERAVRTWKAGVARFPDSAPLLEKLDAQGPDAALPAQQPGDARPPPGPEVGVVAPGSRLAVPAPTYALAPIVVESGGYSMEDVRAATRLSRVDVYTLPGGTADVLQAFQAMP